MLSSQQHRPLTTARARRIQTGIRRRFERTCTAASVWVARILTLDSDSSERWQMLIIAHALQTHARAHRPPSLPLYPRTAHPSVWAAWDIARTFLRANLILTVLRLTLTATALRPRRPRIAYYRLHALLDQYAAENAKIFLPVAWKTYLDFITLCMSAGPVPCLFNLLI